MPRTKKFYRFAGRPLTHKRWRQKDINAVNPSQWIRLNEINSEFKSDDLTLVLPNNHARVQSSHDISFIAECLSRNFGISVNSWFRIFYRSSEIIFNFLNIFIHTLLIAHWIGEEKRSSFQKKNVLKIDYFIKRYKYIYFFFCLSLL